MSILNVWCRPDGAFVAVDTEVQFPGGAKAHAPKIYLLPVPNLILAIRGQFISGQVIFNLLNLSNPATFDQAADCLPKIIDHAVATLIEEARSGAIPYEIHPATQVALCGWSDQHGSFRVAVVDHSGMPTHYECTNTTSVFMPWDSSWGVCPVREAASSAQMLELATHQLRHGRRSFPNSGFGGRLIVAQLKRSETTVRDLGSVST